MANRRPLRQQESLQVLNELSENDSGGEILPEDIQQDSDYEPENSSSE